MDLSWIWAAVAAIAAVLSSVWSLSQTFRSRSAFARYEQWISIRDDHPAGSSVHAYAEAQARQSLVDLAARARIIKLRRRQWFVIAIILMVGVPIAFGMDSPARDWTGTVIGGAIALTLIIADWRVGLARTETQRELFKDDSVQELATRAEQPVTTAS